MTNSDKKKKKVNLKDVAAHAGVSYATVSNVMQGKQIVKEQTRLKVLKAVEELSYYPDLIARSMKKERTFNIGLIVADLSNPFFAESAKVIIETAEKYHCHVTVCVTEEKASKMEEYIGLLINMRVDGILIGSFLKTDAVVRLQKNGIPYVLYSRKNGHDESDYIGLNNRKGGYEAVSHLIRLGHERIGLLHGQKQFDTIEGRIKGYHDALHTYELPACSHFVQEAGVSETDKNLTAAAIDQMFAQEIKPTAIFATGDYLALDAMEILLEKGYRVPRDVAVVGFDNIRLSGHSLIGLTTVGLRTVEMASLAAERLMQKVENRQDPEQHFSKQWEITLEPELIVRTSCGFSLKSE